MTTSKTLGFDAQGYIKASDGTKLHYLSRQIVEPGYQIIGVHGLGEHAGRYAWFADQIAADGGNCSFLNMRGHGLSEGARGHSSSYQQLVSDIELFVAQQKLEQIPTFFFGHSLGGGLALSYALELSSQAIGRSLISGFIAASPLLRLSFTPPAWKLILARRLVKLWPGFSLERGINPEMLTRDKEILAAYIADPLNHELVSAALTLGFLEAGEAALTKAAELKIPTLIMHGDDDQVTAISASREFAKTAGEIVRFCEFPDCYHELVNEINRDQVVATITSWIAEQIDT